MFKRLLAATCAFMLGPQLAQAQITDALVIDDQGEVGVGTDTPSVPLHVLRAPEPQQNLSMFLLENIGASRFDIRNNHNGIHWFFQNDQDGTFKFSRLGSGGSEIIVSQRQDGFAGQPTLFVDGSIQADNVSFTSSRERKKDVRDVDTGSILDKVSALEIKQWRFDYEDSGPSHIGPMAEDFNDMFEFSDNTGEDRSAISVLDGNGIALAAIQGLNQRVAERDRVIRRLQEEISQLKDQRDLMSERLSRLEERL